MHFQETETIAMYDLLELLPAYFRSMMTTKFKNGSLKVKFCVNFSANKTTYILWSTYAIQLTHKTQAISMKKWQKEDIMNMAIMR